MELKDILTLWDRFEKSNAAEMELDFQGAHFALKKHTGITQAETVNVVPVQMPTAMATVPTEETAAEVEAPASLKEIKAPLVGTFYSSPAPDAEPFIKVGDRVKKGDVICIIEAMKLMNEVTAKEEGIVADIVVENGDLVSYNQTLLLLK